MQNISPVVRVVDHPFTSQIIAEVELDFGSFGRTVFELSPILQYINNKTRSANRGSKARSSFANLYALYVLVEDYVDNGYIESGNYSDYEGADFTPLMRRMRELPFGSKLQNHALNNRANDEFHKFFPQNERRPILRDVSTQKYWINEALLNVSVGNSKYNIARTILRIIDQYVETKRESFSQFIADCERMQEASGQGKTESVSFIRQLLSPDKDARLFEIASYAILRANFASEVIFIGWARDNVQEEALRLFKTGRTNANDGGIDFVMRPLGRFFQVTETLDVKKYFLDIDKIERYPISFVVKTTLSSDEIRARLEEGAREQYGVREVVRRYMDAIEDVYNIPRLLEIFDMLVQRDRVAEVLGEIIRWSKVEFNIESPLDSVESIVDDDEEEDD